MCFQVHTRQVGIVTLLALPIVGLLAYNPVALAQANGQQDNGQQNNRRARRADAQNNRRSQNSDAQNNNSSSSTNTQAGARTRSVTMKPVRNHIEAVAFKASNKPDVDLRSTIASLGISIKDQGDRGTCSVFAMTFLIDYEFAKNFNSKNPVFSEEYLNDAKNLATQEDTDGGFFTEIDQGFQKYGIVTDKQDPYRPVFRPGEKVRPALLTKGEINAHKLITSFIKNWDVTTGLTSAQLSMIMAQLKLGVPVASGLRWPNNFATRNIEGIPVMVTPPPSGVTDGHSIDFVGFKQDTHFPGGGYFIFRNSWGTGFEEDGYGYMSFEYALKYANDTLTYTPSASSSPPLHVHPPAHPMLKGK